MCRGTTAGRRICKKVGKKTVFVNRYVRKTLHS
jgi:hypothetical protein